MIGLTLSAVFTFQLYRIDPVTTHAATVSHQRIINKQIAKTGQGFSTER